MDTSQVKSSERTKAPDSGKTMLIADDEPNIRRVLEAIFRKDGYNVLAADNWLQG